MATESPLTYWSVPSRPSACLWSPSGSGTETKVRNKKLYLIWVGYVDILTPTGHYCGSLWLTEISDYTLKICVDNREDIRLPQPSLQRYQLSPNVNLICTDMCVSAIYGIHFDMDTELELGCVSTMWWETAALTSRVQIAFWHWSVCIGLFGKVNKGASLHRK